MFDGRLKFLLILLGVGLAVSVLRLGQLQLVQADYYREQAERSMVLRPTPLAFVRGRLLDRTGAVVVRDEPCWHLSLDYDVIAAIVGADDDQVATDYRKQVIRRIERAGRYPDAETSEDLLASFRDEVAVMWSDIALFMVDTEMVSVDELLGRAAAIYDRVSRVRRAVAGRRGFDAPVAEEAIPQPIIERLGAEQQIAARERLRRYADWLHIVPATTREIQGDGEPLAHVLGRMGRVDAEAVASDPNSDDPFARYRANERLGITGVEYSAEQRLRGRRGQITRDRNGALVEEECFDAQDGEDVTLTVHAGLQERLYHLLRSTVDQVPDSSGGAIVVLDVATREVLALVSYPSYEPRRFDELYASLRDDTDRLPLRFRAVANHYAPGSTIKPLTCLTGLTSGRITLDSRETCTGYLFPDVRDRWRCWQIHGTNQRKAHGSINVVEALAGSCNVFMWRVADQLGVDALCSAFDMVGVGRSSGIGLREETAGINPTPGWLMQYKNASTTSGHARNFAIGQGELSMTPVQVANLMATYASGRYRPVSLLRAAAPTPEWTLPGTREQWGAIRRGIYRVVNDPDGTAYKYAHFEHDRYALCGKTGSATAARWPTAYRIPFVDREGVAQEVVLPAGAKGPAIDRFLSEFPGATFEPEQVEVAAKWPPAPPPAGDRYSHAWFAGFLQALDVTGGPDWSREPRIAFAVLVEFGGSGGRTSGPLAKRVADEAIAVFGPELDTDGAMMDRTLP